VTDRWSTPNGQRL